MVQQFLFKIVWQYLYFFICSNLMIYCQWEDFIGASPPWEQPWHKVGPCRAAPSVGTQQSCRGSFFALQLLLVVRHPHPPSGHLGSISGILIGYGTTLYINIEYLQCHFGIRRIHFNPLKANCSEHRASRLQGKEDPHTERPVHPWVQFLLQRCTADAKSGADTSYQER